MSAVRTVTPGADKLKDKRSLKGKKVALIANQTSVTGDLEPTVERIAALKEGGVVILSPEHGYYGAAMDGERVPPTKDEGSGIAIFSLYGENLKPTDEMLEGVDTIVYDLQDTGSRFYTYLTTMKLCIEAAAEKGLRFVVLDRPDPINGIHAEGPVLEDDLNSFIGSVHVPIRYSLTPGELAKLIDEEYEYKASLEVVTMEGWERDMWFEGTGLNWVPPSPNMPTVETALLYVGTCLFEGTNVSEGRGTTSPFRFIGAPWMEERDLTRDLNQLGLPGVKFAPVRFRPNASKYAGEICKGVCVHVIDRTSFRPFETAVNMLGGMLEKHKEFQWLRSNSGKHYIDFLAGTTKVRESIEKADVAEMLERTRTEAETFVELAKSYWLYGKGS